jgi:hypothetical protein
MGPIRRVYEPNKTQRYFRIPSGKTGPTTDLFPLDGRFDRF